MRPLPRFPCSIIGAIVIHFSYVKTCFRRNGNVKVNKAPALRVNVMTSDLSLSCPTNKSHRSIEKPFRARVDSFRPSFLVQRIPKCVRIIKNASRTFAKTANVSAQTKLAIFSIGRCIIQAPESLFFMLFVPLDGIKCATVNIIISDKITNIK